MNVLALTPLNVVISVAHHLIASRKVNQRDIDTVNKMESINHLFSLLSIHKWQPCQGQIDSVDTYVKEE